MNAGFGFGDQIVAARAAARAERRVKKSARIPKPVAVDFETFEAEPRPWGPPVPTGVSIKYPGKKSRYYAWGHVSGNNCTWAEARDALVEAWAWPDGVVFHNCKFDLSIAYERMDMPELPWDRVHDTMFLGFLDDPNERELGLKPMGLRILGMEAEERDAVADWLCRAQPVPGVKIQPSVGSKNTFMRFLPFAPGDVVGRYADGDDLRTEKLFGELFRSVVVERGMGTAYDRERKLVPVLMENERHGLRVDLPRLRSDVAAYRVELARVDAWLRKKLRAAPDFDVESKEKVVARVFEVGLGDPATWPQTEKSTEAKRRYSSAEEAFRDHCADRAFAGVWAYRLKLATSLVTFMENWLRVAEASGGVIFTDWHQVRGAEGGGARTGRLSSSPNLQNMVKNPEPLFRHEVRADDEDRARLLKILPACPIRGLLPLPRVRSYIVPYAPGEVLLDRDYSQQEPRILAHFEGGVMKKQYLENPWLDFHDNAKENLERVMRRPYKRKAVKNINLGIIYGQGIGSLAEKNNSTVQETKEIRSGILKIYPGLKSIQDQMKALAARGEPLVTWGARKCLCEKPMYVEGKLRTFEYKMVNTLVQGSAADCTKEAMIRFHARKKAGWRLYANVHDELLVSCPSSERDECMEVLRECMESVEFDVPMLSEGEWSPENWALLQTYDKKGERIAA